MCYTALIIDDHPLITEAYKNAFHFIEKQNDEISFLIHLAHDCDSASQVIEQHHTTNKKIDIVFLDISLPPSSNGKIISGEDLGIKINNLLPETKTIVSTTFNDNYRIHSIIKSINPDGFLIKNDITPKELISAIETVIHQPPYYSKTVLNLLRKQISNEFIIDDYDRKILFELSLGAKTKDILKIVPLSKAAIDKRKAHLKEIFDIKSSEDRELIKIAKEKGFI